MQVPTLVGPRLRLRAYRPEDRDDFVRMFTDPIVMEHVDGALETSAAQALFDGLLGLTPPPERVHSAWYAEDEAGRHLGHGALLRDARDLEVAFLLSPSEWGRGLATEMARLLVRQGFTDPDRARLIATVDGDHAASRRVLEKVGMRELRVVTDVNGSFFVYVIEREAS